MGEGRRVKCRNYSKGERIEIGSGIQQVAQRKSSTFFFLIQCWSTSRESPVREENCQMKRSGGKSKIPEMEPGVTVGFDVLCGTTLMFHSAALSLSDLSDKRFPQREAKGWKMILDGSEPFSDRGRIAGLDLPSCDILRFYIKKAKDNRRKMVERRLCDGRV